MNTSAKHSTVLKEKGNDIWFWTLIYPSVALGLTRCILILACETWMPCVFLHIFFFIYKCSLQLLAQPIFPIQAALNVNHPIFDRGSTKHMDTLLKPTRKQLQPWRLSLAIWSKLHLSPLCITSTLCILKRYMGCV